MPKATMNSFIKKHTGLPGSPEFVTRILSLSKGTQTTIQSISSASPTAPTRSASSITRRPSTQSTLKPHLRYPSASLEDGTCSSYRPAQEARQRHQGAQLAQTRGQQAAGGEHRAREAGGAPEEARGRGGGAREEAGRGQGAIRGARGETDPPHRG